MQPRRVVCIDVNGDVRIDYCCHRELHLYLSGAITFVGAATEYDAAIVARDEPDAGCAVHCLSGTEWIPEAAYGPVVMVSMDDADLPLVSTERIVSDAEAMRARRSSAASSTATTPADASSTGEGAAPRASDPPDQTSPYSPM